MSDETDRREDPALRRPTRALPEVMVAVFALLFALGLRCTEGSEAPCGLEWKGALRCSPGEAADLREAPVWVAIALGAPVDLNRATEAELTAVHGIGVRRAAAIVALRGERRGFCSVGELDDVRGIGPATLQALKKHLTVSAPPQRRCDP